MMKDLKVVEFLNQNPDALNILQQKPYNLEIRYGEAGTWSESLVLLRYNQIASDFYLEMVKECRGLILDRADGWKLVCWPFHKFFNQGEIHAHPIDWATARILEKIDGSLIKIWFYKHQWRVSTNGTIDAYSCTIPYDLADRITTFGQMFDRAISRYYSDPQEFYNLLDKDYTYIFEIVGPNNKVVISYPEIDIYWIGRRNIKTGNEAQVNSLLFKLPTPKSYSFTSEVETLEFAKTLDSQHEGFVVVDENFSRQKFKGLTYLRLHSLKGEQGQYIANKVYDILIQNEQEEILAYFPEFKNLFDRVGEQIEGIKQGLQDTLDRFSTVKELTTRKEQAMWAKSNTEYLDFFFGWLDGKYASIDQYMNNARNVNYKRLKN